MPSNNYRNRIVPSMEKVLARTGDYRCERDLHHHLTALFNEVSNLRIGQDDTFVQYEQPTLGRYQRTGSSLDSGNIDIFFVPSQEHPEFASPEGGIAVEVNGNYNDITKIKQDLIKLLDPNNQLGEAVYIIVGIEKQMRRPVELGLGEAITHLAQLIADDSSFTPCFILLVEEVGGWRFLYEGTVVVREDDSDVTWIELDRLSLLENEGDVGDPLRLISKDEAKKLLQDRMRVEGIPLKSKTARCMFEPETTNDGRQLCHFGKTPLWDHEVELESGQIKYAVFIDWMNRLAKYGNSRQG